MLGKAPNVARTAAVAAAFLLLGARPGLGQSADWSGGVTLVGQASDTDQARREAILSADLFLDWAIGPGFLWAYVELNTSPRLSGISSVIREANTDAGTALNRRGQGRFQVSELNYRFEFRESETLVLGLLDATGYLDTSRIANDENLHFLGISFVNNPTIEFPDYALGVVAQRDGGGAVPRVTVLLTSSRGLADNPGLSYGELIRVSRPGKGTFGAVALRWPGDRWRGGVGVWANTGTHERVEGAGTVGSNRGIYGVLGRSWEAHTLNLRWGFADPDAYPAANFIGVTYLGTVGRAAAGLGLARIGASDQLGGDRDDTVHAEAFFRVEVPGGLYLTPSLQYLANSGFDGSGQAYPPSLWIAGVRLSYVF